MTVGCLVPGQVICERFEICKKRGYPGCLRCKHNKKSGKGKSTKSSIVKDEVIPKKGTTIICKHCLGIKIDGEKCPYCGISN